jgi:hypothetical protein
MVFKLERTPPNAWTRIVNEQPADVFAVQISEHCAFR